MSLTHGVEVTALPWLAGVTALVTLSFTPVEITSLTVAFAAIIAALFTGVTQVITALRTTQKLNETTQKLDENTQVTQTVKAAVEVVAGHVNSAATASAAKIDALQREVIETRAQIAEMKQIAALLAQSQASSESKAEE